MSLFGLLLFLELVSCMHIHEPLNAPGIQHMYLHSGEQTSQNKRQHVVFGDSWYLSLNNTFHTHIQKFKILIIKKQNQVDIGRPVQKQFSNPTGQCEVGQCMGTNYNPLP